MSMQQNSLSVVSKHGTWEHSSNIQARILQACWEYWEVTHAQKKFLIIAACTACFTQIIMIKIDLDWRLLINFTSIRAFDALLTNVVGHRWQIRPACADRSSSSLSQHWIMASQIFLYHAMPRSLDPYGVWDRPCLKHRKYLVDVCLQNREPKSATLWLEFDHTGIGTFSNLFGKHFCKPVIIAMLRSSFISHSWVTRGYFHVGQSVWLVINGAPMIFENNPFQARLF